MDYKKLSEFLFPDIEKDHEFYEKKYKKRMLDEGAKVTRFAPSPTGFIHFGGLFTSFISYIIAKKTKGYNILRIEDTDSKRKVDKGVDLILDGLKNFDIQFDEYPGKGDYGPYIQSERVDIYRSFAKKLVQEGKAYPCFCSDERLENDKKQQKANKELIGYYGPYAHCRNLSHEEIEQNLSEGKKFAIRLRVDEQEDQKIKYKDALRGKMNLHNNYKDVVILKSKDHLPPYNFAHIIDDYLMGVNIAIRGDEFLPSLAEHLQIYKALGFSPVKYAHIAPIQILDNGKKRKLSKRKDEEAAVDFYYKKGYPSESVKDYIMTIANSNFENWRVQNPGKDILEFDFKLNKMSNSGALFDLDKLESVSRNTISKMTAKEVYEKTSRWAKDYDIFLYDLLKKYPKYSENMFNIERGIKKPRKDIAKWSDVKKEHNFFFDELFNPTSKKDYEFDYDDLNIDDLFNILKSFVDNYNDNDERAEWFGKIKRIALENGYADDMKKYKENPDRYKGHYGEVSIFIRIALTGRKKSPDLFEICKILGKERIEKRLDKAISILNN